MSQQIYTQVEFQISYENHSQEEILNDLNSIALNLLADSQLKQYTIKANELTHLKNIQK